MGYWSLIKLWFSKFRLEKLGHCVVSLKSSHIRHDKTSLFAVLMNPRITHFWSLLNLPGEAPQWKPHGQQ